jgi:hypothetical protein
MNKQKTRFLYASFIILTSSFALSSPGCSSGYDDRVRADDSKTSATRLRIEEAKAIMHVYEIRLHNVKVNAEQEDVTWANVRETFEKKNKSFVDGAISEKELRDAKEDYDKWQVKDQIKDIEEAQALLDIAKIRVQMVEAGMEVYRGNMP